jgi:hypothetical protein
MNRKQILTIAFIVDSLCWIALGFFIGFSTNAIGGNMTITAETTLNPEPIEVGSQVIYVCPWTGFDRTGQVVAAIGADRDGLDGEYFDIECDDGTGVDTSIHSIDIRPID